MEVQIKKAVRSGNSSAVIVPRSWLNKEVRVELVKKGHDLILNECLEILNKHIGSSSIIGIYLVGSYAREEEDENSDIDILVISDNLDRSINDGIYNILVVSKGLLKQKLQKDILPIGPMIKEAKPLLNQDYLNSLDIGLTRSNINWYLESTEEKLLLIRKVIDKLKRKNKKFVPDRIAYTIILRIRTLYIINKLVNNKKYLKKEFIELIRDICGSINPYICYLAIKNESKNKNNTKIEEIEKLYGYLNDQFLKIKNAFK